MKYNLLNETRSTPFKYKRGTNAILMQYYLELLEN